MRVNRHNAPARALANMQVCSAEGKEFWFPISAWLACIYLEVTVDAPAQLARHAKRHNAPARALANMQVCFTEALESQS